jgi:hypothetical protein
MKRWWRRKPYRGIEKTTTDERSSQRVDPTIAEALERPENLGVAFPPSHRSERSEPFRILERP